MTDKIFDHNSKEFDLALNVALEEAATRRCNPNKSPKATYEGYCNAIDRVGKDLAKAAKNALEKTGWLI
ncbi:MAG: hypothetical protein LBU89_10435 [Fibromonadaceae bacterium]|jgi:hypothetical protein|nr:hypothetical protein [Fibromonadaceae bacterium]